jgi:signal recognition particle subunit SEC65
MEDATVAPKETSQSQGPYDLSCTGTTEGLQLTAHSLRGAAWLRDQHDGLENGLTENKIQGLASAARNYGLTVYHPQEGTYPRTPTGELRRYIRLGEAQELCASALENPKSSWALKLKMVALLSAMLR